MTGEVTTALMHQAHQQLWHSQSSMDASISVVVSLFNYRECIGETLTSLYAQTCSDLALLVVDDASTDGGAELVEEWLREHGHRFRGATLLRHTRNCGLAAARNTGFAHARSSWVWVQDADNPLCPWAIEQVLRLASRVQPEVAVIHPLLVTESESATVLPLQGGGRPWQRSCFLRANAIDAMALVRREAWQSVGGYSHIEGGWEDYDFWCKLTEVGWHGVQCPQVLGTYRVHARSMTATTALPDAQRLEGILQSRHPWLNCLGWTSHPLPSPRQESLRASAHRAIDS
jgi:GT2 family glycosyltransferase